MKGIIYKDYLMLLLPKNLFSFLANFVVAIPIICFFENVYGLALTCILLFPMSGTTLLQLSMEQDELSQFDKIQLTFPLTKKEIILSKYMGGLFFLGISSILSFLTAMFYYAVYQVGDLSLCLQIWAFGVICGIFFLAVSYVGFYLLGNKKGTFMYFILTIISVVIYLLGFFNFDAMSIFNMNYNILLLIGFIIVILLLGLSYYLSLKIYTKKYS